MAIRGKEVRPLIDGDMHECLAIMAEHREMQINELAGSLLEKAIAGEWHQVRVLIRRSERLGKRWRDVESND
jgi:hypothetical protein